MRRCAFYAAFSIAPLLVIALSVAALFFGEEAVRSEIAQQIHTLMGEQAGKAVEQSIVNADAKEHAGGTFAAVLSIGILLFGASGVFGQLQSSLNTIWKVRVRKGRGWVLLIRDRMLSFVMVLCVCTLLLVLLVLSAILSSLDIAVVGRSGIGSCR